MTDFNWQLRLDAFHLLSDEEARLFAPPTEAHLAAGSFNEALQAALRGESAEATRRLRQITEDYPLFPQASHLYGLLLAANGDVETACTYYERTRLLPLSREEAKGLTEEYQVLASAWQTLQRSKRQARHREKVLQPLKAELGRRSILMRAPRLEAVDLKNYRAGEENEPLDLPDPAERRKTLRSLLWALAAGILILLLFFFFWRPALLREQHSRIVRQERLQWLEAELASRAAAEPAIQDLLNAYAAWEEAGQPPRESVSPRIE